MNVLQIPIMDEYWVAPQDPAAQTRSKDFAIQKGFGESSNGTY
jgi:glutamine amidotransferase